MGVFLIQNVLAGLVLVFVGCKDKVIRIGIADNVVNLMVGMVCPDIVAAMFLFFLAAI